MKRIWISLALFGLSYTTWPNVLDLNITRSRIVDFDFPTVCKTLGISHPILIEEKGPVILDCMGTEVSANEFCQKKFVDDKQLLRGVISSREKKVLCQFGKEAVLKLNCEKNYEHFCRDSKIGCLQLKNIYAFNLELTHHSLVEGNFNKKNISCYYQSNTASEVIPPIDKDISD